jgi:hypothetical protein
VVPVAGEEEKTYSQVEVDAMVAEHEKGLKANRDEALKEAKAAKAALKNYEGVDPEEFKTLKAAASEAERRKAAADGDFKALEKQLVDRHATELGGKDTKIGKLTKALERRLVDAELIRAITAKKGEPDLLLPYARQFMRVKETDDDFEGYVADERGNPLVADGKGTPMDVNAFVEQTLMVKFPRAFEGTGSSGGGASKSIAGGGGGQKVIAVPANGRISMEDIEGLAKGTTVTR